MATTGSAARLSDRAAGAVAVVVLLIVVALAFFAQWLKHPYYEIDRVCGYVFMFGLVVYQLRACYRVATAPEHKGKLTMVSFFLALKAMADLANLELVFQGGDRKIVRALMDIGMFLALYFALVLVEMILKKPAAISPDEGLVSPPSA
jgi:hypothetical protein